MKLFINILILCILILVSSCSGVSYTKPNKGDIGECLAYRYIKVSKTDTDITKREVLKFNKMYKERCDDK